MELLFADDLLIFTKSDPLSLGKLKEVIGVFAKTSGLPNSSKSVIYLARVSVHDVEGILEVIGVPKRDLPFR